MIHKETIKAPLSKKSTKLKYQVQIFVPSTKFEKTIKPQIYQDRINTTRKFLSSTYGGDTTIKGSGGFIFKDEKNLKGQLVKEKIAIVETSMTKEDYLKNKPKLEKFIKSKKKDWKQESIGYKFEDDLYIYPKFN